MKQLEAAKLKRENEQLQALVAKIPPEIRERLRQRERHTKHHER